ncbi:hypothetical protein LTS10_013337 [Elasticomyces elasticus]|nr:hypothetical protein LTS10_013337 [Elasticomyces elasticus]
MLLLFLRLQTKKVSKLRPKKSRVARRNLSDIWEKAHDDGLYAWRLIQQLERVDCEYEKRDTKLEDHPRALEVFGVISNGSTRSLAHLDILLSPGEFFSLNQLVHGRIGQSVLLSSLKLSRKEDVDAWQATIAGGDRTQVHALEEHDFKFCRCEEGGVTVYHAASDRTFVVKEAAFEQLREMLEPYTQVTLVGEDYIHSSWWEWVGGYVHGICCVGGRE